VFFFGMFKAGKKEKGCGRAPLLVFTELGSLTNSAPT
jgi:hypothetical protein